MVADQQLAKQVEKLSQDLATQMQVIERMANQRTPKDRAAQQQSQPTEPNLPQLWQENAALIAKVQLWR